MHILYVKLHTVLFLISAPHAKKIVIREELLRIYNEIFTLCTNYSTYIISFSLFISNSWLLICFLGEHYANYRQLDELDILELDVI